MFKSLTAETKRISDACLAASVNSQTWQDPEGRLHPYFYGEAPTD